MQHSHPIRTIIVTPLVAIMVAAAAFVIPITVGAAESDESRAKSELLAAIRSIISALTDIKENGGDLSAVGDDVKDAIIRITNGIASYNAKDFKGARSHASEAGKIAKDVRDSVTGKDEDKDEDEDKQEEDDDSDEDEDKEAEMQAKAAEAIQDATDEVLEVQGEISRSTDIVAIVKAQSYLAIAVKWNKEAQDFYDKGNWSEAYRYAYAAEGEALKAGNLL